MIEYQFADTAAKYEEAARLFKAYAEDINIDLSFQEFDKELDDLATMYSPPEGGIILCLQDVRYIGCIAIRRIDNEICELKRMYVAPGFRNLGIAKNLLEEAIALAVKLGYKKIRLDTLDSMKAAIGLYEEYGFRQIPAYYFNPNKSALYFEKDLK